ncbi:MAG: sigma-70 family RNA polymerase sigma factor [Anaerolineae bacterium]
MEQTEQALVIRAQQGDYLAFEELHALLEPAISRFVRRLIGYGQAAEDIVQDTFLALYTHLDQIRPDENIRPYVYRVARNRCYDMLRRQGRYEQLSLDDEPTELRVSFDLHHNGQAPDDVAHWLLLQLEVQEAIDQLPEAQRQTLILYSEQEMSYTEIAEVMEVSVGTVKSRLFHARKALRGLLKPETLAAIHADMD